MTETTFLTDEEVNVSHHGNQVIILELGDEEYALTREAAGEAQYHLGTCIGCLRGVDSDAVPRNENNRKWWR